jgi:hypothetical protein
VADRPAVRTQEILRGQLAAALGGNMRAVRLLESLYIDVGKTLPDAAYTTAVVAESAVSAADTAQATANSAQAAALSAQAAADAAAALAALAYERAKIPVGSVHVTIDPVNPATALGYGTWSAFGSGRVLIGVDPADSDFNPVEKTGGSKTATL